MSWSNEISKILINSLGFNGIRSFYSTAVKNYLDKYESNISTDPYLLSSVYLSTKGFSIFEDKAFRKTILESLNKDEVIILAKSLNLKLQGIEELRNSILNIQWDWSSNKVKEFCAFFNCSDVIDEALKYKETEVSSAKVVSELSGSTRNFYELHPFQSQIRSDVIKHFTIENQQKALIQLPTGTGKTRVAVHTVIKYLNDHTVDRKNIIWLAYSPLLLKQALETFEDIWPVIGKGDISVGQFYGGINTEYTSSKRSILFANVSVLLGKYKSELKEIINKNTCLIVFDEAHQSVANDARNLLVTLLHNENIKLIGLTATPGRSATDESENMKLVQFFEGNRFEITVPEDSFFIGSSANYTDANSKNNSAIYFLQKEGVLAHLKHEVLKLSGDKTELKNNDSEDAFVSSVLKKLAVQPERNNLIINKAIDLSAEKKKTLIFACTVDHAKDLVSLLKLRNINAGLVIGENNEERDVLIEKFMNSDELNILISLDVLTTGFDAPNVDALIITRPTSSVITYSQILGRALRGPMNGGHDTNYIYNIDTPFYGDEIDAYKHFESYWS